MFCSADESTNWTSLMPWFGSPSQLLVTSPPRHQTRWMSTFARRTMGSVSSVINGSSLDTDHCKALEYQLKKEKNLHRRSGSRSLDGLLNCGFTQGSSSSTYASKGLAYSHSGQSEDFFYIKVSLLGQHLLCTVNSKQATVLCNSFGMKEMFVLFCSRWAINQGRSITGKEKDRWKIKATGVENQMVRSPSCCSCPGISLGRWEKFSALMFT